MNRFIIDSPITISGQFLRRRQQVAAEAAAAAAEQLLRPMQGARGGGAQERVQHVLLGLHRRAALLTLPRLSQGSPPHSGQIPRNFVSDR